MAEWYLVLALASSVLSPLPRQQPLMGPVSHEQCEQAKDQLAKLPNVVSATCRKAVAMITKSEGAIAYAYPVFEGEFTGVGSSRPTVESSDLPPYTPRKY